MRRASARFALAALGLGLAAACALRAPRIQGSGNPCASSQQCAHDEVCFLGECRGQAAALGDVLAEVRPPGDSVYGAAQRAELDLRSSVVVDFQLSEHLAAAGVVQQAQVADGGAASAATPIPGATVSFAPLESVIPERSPEVIASTGTQGEFSARLAAGRWSVSVSPPAPLPPWRSGEPLEQSRQQLDLRLPPASDLVRIPVAITVNGAPLVGARVVAVDALGRALSAPVLLAADGAGQLLLPPGPPAYLLRVGPGPDAPAATSAVPTPTFDALGPFSGRDGVRADLGALPPSAVLTGKVVGPSGAGVGGARVYALSLDGERWSISRSTSAGADGTFKLTLRSGRYVVQAAPASGADAPALSAEQELDVQPGGAPVSLRCSAKTVAEVQVRRPDGSAASALTQISATRLPGRLITARVAQVRSLGSGLFELAGDPGSYRLELAPPPESGLPRKIVTLELPEAGGLLPEVRLSPPLQAVGTITGSRPGAASEPVAGATVEFFALDASGTKAVSLGSAVTDAKGRYQAVLPDVEATELQRP